MPFIITTRRLIPTLHSRNFFMDAVITQDRIKVLPHTQYKTPDVLSPSTAPRSPLDQFRVWFKDAVENPAVVEPETMTLSTATASGMPSCRIVLFKQLDKRGFVFFTNYASRKSQELDSNPHAALVFYWRELHRQVRVVGKVEKVSRQESEEYFQTRPLGSRLGAWASNQSSVVREGELMASFQAVKERFNISDDDKDGQVPLPEFWGGWRVVPLEVEFWAGKPSRLHDRVRYLREKEEDDNWTVDMLAP